MPRLSLVSIFTRPQSFIFVMIPLLFFVSVLLLLSRSPVSSIATSSKPVIPAQPSHPSLATTAKPPLPSEPLSPPSSSPLSAAPAFNERQTAVRDVRGSLDLVLVVVVVVHSSLHRPIHRLFGEHGLLIRSIVGAKTNFGLYPSSATRGVALG